MCSIGFKCQLYRRKLSNYMRSPTTMGNTKNSNSACIDYTCTSAAETLEVIQGNFVSEKAFWSSYRCDGITCPEIRVQIRINPLSEICGFLATQQDSRTYAIHIREKLSRLPTPKCSSLSTHSFS